MTSQLLAIGRIWAKTSRRSLATLGSKVHSDSQFFDKLVAGRTCSISTFEKFLSFFRSGNNWPDGRIPEEAMSILDNFENIATDAAASIGKACNISSGSAAATGGAA